MSEICRVAQKRFNEIVVLIESDCQHDIAAGRRVDRLFNQLMGMQTALDLSGQHDDAIFVSNLVQSLLHTYQHHGAEL